MNALLSYNSQIPPGLGYNQPYNMAAYNASGRIDLSEGLNNFDLNGLTGVSPLSMALSAGGMYGMMPGMYGNMGLGVQRGLSLGNSNPLFGNLMQLRALLQAGAISKKEYAQLKKEMLGLEKEDGDDSTSSTRAKEPTASLHGKDMEKARKSSKGAYKVTDEHSEVASKCIDDITKKLNKSPELVSESEIKQIEEMFNKINENPMLAEAFVEKAQEIELSGSGKTKTLLGRLQEVLTKHYGEKAAEEQIKSITERFGKNVYGRNADLWRKFSRKSGEDATKIEVSSFDKTSEKASEFASSHPISSVAGGLTALGLAWKLPGWLKIPALAIAGLGTLGYGIYKEWNHEK